MESLMTQSTEQLHTLEPTAVTRSEAGPDAPAHPLAGLDDDVEADLAAIGIQLTPDVERALEQERRIAMAAALFRRAMRVRAELAETERAMGLELDMVRAHYERQMAPRRAVEARLLTFIQTLAELTPWGKKKSHATPYGTFGVKDYAPTVELKDREALLAHMKTDRPGLVRVTVTMTYGEALEYFTDEELARTATLDVEWGKLKGVLDVAQPLPPGVALVPARREAYAKLANNADMAGEV